MLSYYSIGLSICFSFFNSTGSLMHCDVFYLKNFRILIFSYLILDILGLNKRVILTLSLTGLFFLSTVCSFFAKRPLGSQSKTILFIIL